METQHNISPEDLRPGHLLGTRYAVVDDERVATKFAPVEKVEICPGQWRTHVHVTLHGSSLPGCYDSRFPVAVKGRG